MQLRGSPDYRFEGLEPGDYEIRVEAAGYYHEGFEFVTRTDGLSRQQRERYGPNENSVVERDLFLLPPDWAWVTVYSREDRTLAELERELEIEHRAERLRIVASKDVPASELVPEIRSFAEFVPAQPRDVRSLPWAVIGVVRTQVRRPFWLGFAYGRHSIGWAELEGAREVTVVFEIELADVARGAL